MVMSGAGMSDGESTNEAIKGIASLPIQLVEARLRTWLKLPIPVKVLHNVALDELERNRFTASVLFHQQLCHKLPAEPKEGPSSNMFHLVNGLKNPLFEIFPWIGPLHMRTTVFSLGNLVHNLLRDGKGKSFRAQLITMREINL
jgi:hypothetical protein